MRLKRFIAVPIVSFLCVALFAGAQGIAAPTASEAVFDEGQPFAFMDTPEGVGQLGETDWMLPGFDARDWYVGSGAFGAKNGGKEGFARGFDPKVLLMQYDSEGDNLPVYYFRTTFDMPDGEGPEAYAMEIAYDDAIIMYLNGKVVYEGNVPEEGFDEEGYGAETVWEEPHVDVALIPRASLRSGTNMLAIELHQASKSSSDIYLEVGALRDSKDYVIRDKPSVRNEKSEARDESVFLGVGATPDQMLVTWHGSEEDGLVDVVEDMNGTANFTKDCMQFSASAAHENKDKTVTLRATLDGLVPGRAYWYRVWDASDELPSVPQYFEVPRTSDFTFVVSGDAQIIDADDPEPMETYEQLFAAVTQESSPSFVLSLGDQSDVVDDPSLFRTFVNSPAFNSVPVAAVVGNHEYRDSAFSHFFSLPNMADNGTENTGDMGGDYWFARGNTLFLVLNSNNDDAESHAEFMDEVKAAYTQTYGEPTWIIAAFHHSLYSIGEHGESDTVLALRDSLVPYLEEVGVDVVFSGHDHYYGRTYPLRDGTVAASEDDEYNSNDGIIYFTEGSSTGTKFYEEDADNASEYLAMTYTDDLPSMTRVDVTDTQLTVSTYARDDEGNTSLIDQCTIVAA